jgi:hypothetical protein
MEEVIIGGYVEPLMEGRNATIFWIFSWKISRKLRLGRFEGK